MGNQRRWHAVNRRQKNAVHDAGCRNIIVGTVSGIRPAKCAHQVEQTMGFQARKGDFRQIKRIEPKILLQGLASRILGAERSVEVCVVGHHIGIAHEFDQPRYRLVGAGCISHILVADVRKMGNIVRNPRVWIAPIVTSAITGPLATCVFHLQMNGAPVSSGMGTCGLVGQIGVYTGWVADVASGTKSAITTMDWVGLILISFVLPAVLCPLINMVVRKLGWVKDGDLTLSNN